MTEFKSPSWSARNPLGIIALFIFLIYAISALLLGAAVSHLTQHNQTVLVWFLVLFPVAVLLAFVWLVTRHHMKLYGPSDFRKDESFLGTTVRGSELLERKNQENAELSAQPSIPEKRPGNLSKARNTTHADIKPSNALLVANSRLLAIESVVFQEIQFELEAPISREVRLKNGFVLDGLAEKDDAYIVIEIKSITKESLVRRAREVYDWIRRVRPALPKTSKRIEYRFALALLDDTTKEAAEERFTKLLVEQSYALLDNEKLIVTAYPVGQLVSAENSK